MFDFERWCSWAEAQCRRRAPANGTTAQFFLGGPSPKRSATVDFKSDRRLMQFAFWETGEADFYGLDLDSGQDLVGFYGRLLTDASFEETFFECLFAVT
jgi:hypothetical protein